MSKARDTDVSKATTDRKVRNVIAARKRDLRRQSAMPRRALTYALAFASPAACWIYFYQSDHVPLFRRLDIAATDWTSRREEVKNASVISWDAYEKHAWGYDRFHPISQSGSQMSPNGIGWIIVDSLDTLMIMNLTTQLAEARRWVSRKLDYTQEQEVNTFETTIRMLGGLLSAHYLATVLPDVSSKRDGACLSKAVDLGDRLLGAYETPSGVPFDSIWLSSGEGVVRGGASSTAEATTLQIEMKYLSHLTGKAIYWWKAERVMKTVNDNMAKEGLVPIYINPSTGTFVSPEVRLGNGGDSHYEYLIKQYLHTAKQEPIYLDMWQEALTVIEKHLVIPTKKSQLRFIAELPHGIGGSLSPKMDHLVCFLPGSIALGATGGKTEAEARKLPGWNARKDQETKPARELMKTCWAMYKVTETGLVPEIAWFNADPADLQADHQGRARQWRRSRENLAEWKEDFIIKPNDAHNLQRPETVESLFMMWRITKDPLYREWGWAIFKAFEQHTYLGEGMGYTSLDNVNGVPPPRRDNMESFWLAETLKYLYLLFSPDDLLPLTEVVFNTEAHVMPVIRQDRFKTGWQRRPR